MDKIIGVIIAILVLSITIPMIINFDDTTEDDKIREFSMCIDILSCSEEQIIGLDRLLGVSTQRSYQSGFSEIKNKETAIEAAHGLFDILLTYRYKDNIEYKERIEIVYSKKHEAWFAKYSNCIIVLKAENAEVMAILMF